MSMFDEPLLLVPIHVDALAVGKSLPPSELFQWTNLAPKFSKLKDEYCLGPELVGNPFHEATALEPGIHLHFRLPRAFSHGQQQGAGALEFPAIPNRWLVQRVCQGPDKALSHKVWIIKSDAPAADGVSGIPWPVFPKDGQTLVTFQSIGTCTELTAPLDEREEPAAVKLTAVGQGNPLFSAYYPACRTVLGFHDGLTDVPKNSRLSYLVTGWFSAAADDPLHGTPWNSMELPAGAESAFRSRHGLSATEPLNMEQRSALRWHAWLEQRQWTCEFDGKIEPGRLLCHGLVKGISWVGDAANYQQTSHGSSEVEIFPLNTSHHQHAYKVAVGNTGGEALAALLARGAVDQELLAGLQDDLFGQSVTAAELSHELHLRRFGTLRGGTLFTLQQEADPSQVIEGSPANPPARRQSDLIPGPLRSLLRALNQAQSRCDQLAREVEDCRWQVYALWYLWTSESKAGFVEPDPATKQEHKLAATRFLSQLDAFKAALKKAGSDLELAGNALVESKGRMITELGKYPKTRPDGTPQTRDNGEPGLKYRLATSSAQPFYEPNEPVIAVGGPAMAGVRTWVRVGSHACRLSGRIVKALDVQVPDGNLRTVTGKTLREGLIPVPETFLRSPGIHGFLLEEALLLDEQYAAAIAGHVSAADVDLLTPRVQALQDPTSSAAQANPARDPNKLNGLLPDRTASFRWPGNPWIPLVLGWEVSWRPDYTTTLGQPLGKDLVTRGWNLASSGDLVPGQSHRAGGTGVNYQGWSVLSSSASGGLAKRLKALNESHPLIDILESQKVQLQRLDGFNDALIQQKPALQVPPLDFQSYRAQKGRTVNLDPVNSALNPGSVPASPHAQFRTVPDTLKPFLPIRSGQLTIARLSVVDAFGQTLKLPVAQMNNSAGTKDSNFHPSHTCVVGELPGAGSVLTLRPRFVQPMRLRFGAANAVADPRAGDEPVCGWILPNHLEKSLTIYAANGNPLGALQQKLGPGSGTTERGAFYWVNVPGGGNGGAVSTAQDSVQRMAAAVGNRHLRHFCGWALKLTPEMGRHFSTLMSESIASADRRVPDQDPGVAVLVGRPLALVRAGLQFEAAGLPAHRPELRAVTGTSVPDLLETNGIENVAWPVRLGDLTARNDGLIGVFKCSAGESGVGLTASGPFYPASGPDNAGSIQNEHFSDQDFEIDCVNPLEVTMLMDPQARVHATTGVLPRTWFELPPEAATGARRAREVFFQTAPILGFSPTPGMPRPSDDYGEWSWASRPDVTHWRLDPSLVEATDRAGFADAWPTITEGWLKLAIAPVRVLSFWLREPVEAVVRGARVHLSWSFQGAESLKLVEVRHAIKDGQSVETIQLVKEWNSPPLPGEYQVTLTAETTYRLIASAEDAADHHRDLTVKIAADQA